MTRPQSVSPTLAKGEGQNIVCQCGNQFNAPHDVKQAQCPSCHEQLDWNLRK